MKMPSLDTVVREGCTAGILTSAFLFAASTFADLGCGNMPSGSVKDISCQISNKI